MTLTVLPVGGIGEVRPGDDLVQLVADTADLRDGDVVVVAQKVVSKAEGALVTVPAGQDRAVVRRRLAREHAVRVVAEAPWTVIVETTHGLICANAGIDASNVPAGMLALLPADPDDSARRLRAGLRERRGVDVGVVISDTFGRPWRRGLTDVAIGLAGLPALRDERGTPDRQGVRLEVTEVALADDVAAAADLVRRKAEGVPVVVIRGLDWQPDPDARAADLHRPAATDLFPRGRGMLAHLLAAPPALGEPGGPSERDWQHALAAARRTGGAGVRIRREPAQAYLTAEDGFALGAATATLVAALTDQGWATAVMREASSAVVRVAAARQ